MTPVLSRARQLLAFREAVVEELEQAYGDDVTHAAVETMLQPGTPDFRDVADAEGIDPCPQNAEAVAELVAERLV